MNNTPRTNSQIIYTWREDVTGCVEALETVPAELARTLETELATAQARLDAIRKLCGYVEDGSDEVVKIFQDDATRTWHISVGRNGKQEYWAESFTGVLDKALPPAPTASA